MSFVLRLRPRGAGTLSLAIGLLALALARAAAQQDAGAPPQQSDQQDEERDIGWIQGLVTGPTGAPQKGGTVSLSTDGGVTLRYNFTVSPKGDYTGRVPLGEYTLVYRAPGTPEGKVTDFIHGVVIFPGKGTTQDVDMTRQEYYDRLSPEQQDELRKMKESNDNAEAANKMIASINADLQTANRDFVDAANARATAIRTLGSTASAFDVDSQAGEIRASKYTEIESLMSKATAEMPNQAEPWIDLGRAQLGLKNYLDAETSFKKALDLISQAANPSPQAASPDPQATNPSPQATNIDPQLVAAALAGLGEVYARTRMVDEANASVAAAVKADPAHAATYLRNLAVIFFQEKNISAQIDAAEEAIKANPKDAVLYFIKADGLAVDAPTDPATNKIKLSAECLVAFREYLGLAPTGEYAAQVNSILQNADLENAGPQNANPQNTGNGTGAASPPAATNPPAATSQPTQK
ncbi:MAG TPA: carboxypeptidase regulatory-like domain-containing protein [Terracidiphilus sp.]|nr:carboxypeptidase regulatory-like domain-containing protein [Terracidiphilus sp.]